MPSLKDFAAKIFAKYVTWTTKKWSTNPVESQKKVFSDLLEKAKKTEFGRDHNFEGIKSHRDFVQKVPIRDYEGLRDYIEKAVNGKENVLWPGKPLYFASTSGTTSGVKNIPITKDSMPAHI
ncbi:MAG: GH3 auxin-responsive promoter family protein, partial [Flavobacteriaceae bacterium]|nr:GH3 auxin-responsive promoter family protein [Flavobacteriaceae bacterium]